MMEAECYRKLSLLQRGSKVILIPMNLARGDLFTTVGVPCSNENESPFEIRDPTEGLFEDFDGNSIKMRTPNYYSFKVSISEIKDLKVLSN